jgi:hypothetical protein
MAARLRGTARNAGRLYAVLGATPPGPAERLDFNRDELSGKSADEIMDRVVEAVSPVEGALDDEESRKAVRDALSELLEQYPEADLLNLSEEQRLFAVERYIGENVYGRFASDFGPKILAKFASATAAVELLRQVRDYIKETVSAAFRKVRAAGATVRARLIRSIAHAALVEACAVFEQEAT